LLVVILLGSCAVAGYACYQFFAEVGGFAEGGGVYRTFSVFGWSNTLGFFLIMPAGLAAFVVINARDGMARLGSLAALTIIGSGLFFTFGRAAWIGAAVAVAGPVLRSTSSLKSVLVLPAMAILGLFAVDVTDIDLSDRLTDPTNYIGREVVRDIGIRLSMESPLFGHGFLSSSDLFESTYDTLLARGFHNIYVLTLYEFGLIGLIIFLLTWVVFAVECVRRFPRAGPRQRHALVTALSILAGVLLASWAGNDLINFAPSIYLWIILAWASASRVYDASPNDDSPCAEARWAVRTGRAGPPRRSPVPTPGG
jgi:O-antigen ligase